jgi:hypothetical protein
MSHKKASVQTDNQEVFPRVAYNMSRPLNRLSLDEFIELGGRTASNIVPKVTNTYIQEEHQVEYFVNKNINKFMRDVCACMIDQS